MNRGVIITVGLTLLALLVMPGVSAADQWPQFRGPQAGAVADDPALPDTWSETENIVWKIDIPGLSWSSPVVWDDHIFITTAISAGEEPMPIPGLYDPGDEQGSLRSSAVHSWILYDVDFETGQIRWARELHRAPPPVARHIKNTFASETPVTDGERVYVYFGSTGLLAALDLNGTLVWTKDVGASGDSSGFGTAASPVLHEDRLYIINDNTTQSFIAAFDKRTGDEIWKVNREENGGNWATPLVWENELRTEIVTSGRGKVRSYDLDGTLLWELRGMTVLNVPSPFARHGLVYISAGYPGGGLRPVYAIRPGASGDISLWPDRSPAGRLASRASGPTPWTTMSSGPTRCSAPTTRQPWSTAITTTRCSTAAFCCVTTPGRASRYTAVNASRPELASPRRRGRTTERFSC